MAAAYLSLCGYRILERNFRFGRLEIDLIAARENLLVFVEVKYRATGRKGPAGAAVHLRKQQDLETAAAGFLRQRHIRAPVRFDVITLEEEEGKPGELRVKHLRHAFTGSGRYR
jgi:putative endonuclease